MKVSSFVAGAFLLSVSSAALAAPGWGSEVFAAVKAKKPRGVRCYAYGTDSSGSRVLGGSAVRRTQDEAREAALSACRQNYYTECSIEGCEDDRG